MLGEIGRALDAGPVPRDPHAGAREVHDAFMSAWHRRCVTSKRRLVYNGSALSEHLRPLPFAMSFATDLYAAVPPGSYVATADLKGGFHHVVMSEDARRWLGIMVGGQMYRWCRLPFGISQAPFLFCLLTAELTYLLRARGVRVVVTYVDDIIVVADTAAAGVAAMGVLQEVCTALGIELAPDKLRAPAQRQVVLGHTLDTTGERVQLRVTPQRLATNALCTALLRALQGATAHVRVRMWAPSAWVMTVVGKLDAQAAVTPLGRAYMAPAWRLSHLAGTSTQPLVSLRGAAALPMTVRFWRSREASAAAMTGFHAPVGMIGEGHEACLASDASGDPTGERGWSGLAGLRGGVAIWARRNASVRSSTELEAEAALLTLLQFATDGESLLACTDSQALAHCLNSGRASVGDEGRLLPALVRQYLGHVESSRVALVAVCLPRQLMRVCDAISKGATLEEAQSLATTLCRTAGITPPIVLRAPVWGKAEAGDVGEWSVRIVHRCTPEACSRACTFDSGGTAGGAGGTHA